MTSTLALPDPPKPPVGPIAANSAGVLSSSEAVAQATPQLRGRPA